MYVQLCIYNHSDQMTNNMKIITPLHMFIDVFGSRTAPPATVVGTGSEDTGSVAAEQEDNSRT